MSSAAPSPRHAQPQRLDQGRHAVRTRHDSLRAEDTSVRWVKRFLLLHDKRHPRAMGLHEVSPCLTHLALDGHGAASTQRQAWRAW